MQLDFAFLANFAAHLQDGRLVVFGADIDGMECVGFPALASQLVLVAKFWVFPEEPTEGHRLSIDLTKPGGQRIQLRTDEPLEAIRNQRNPDRPSAAQVTVNLMMTFDAVGIYLFHLSIDGQEVKAVPFQVSLVAPESEQANEHS